MTTTTHTSLRRRLGALLLAACYSAYLPALAAPTAPQVVAGQATFSQQGNVFSITNTPGAIINWQSFNIGAGEITRFIQQGSDSAVLNRVLGQDPSKILGALQSNGKVFLINPNGILFGQGARVDVNGLVASTLDIADADFKAGRMNFNAGATAGSVRNEGAITTPAGGQVFLLAPNVENKGIVNTPGGEVVLAAGHSVQLADSSDPDLHVVVSAPADQALNLGQVIAQGGRIGILGALVSQRGLVNADSAVRGADGKIVLKASRVTQLGAGSVTSAVGSAGKGGEIRVLGPQVAIESNASVDASGAAQGGKVLVGGDWQGAAGTPQARELTMAAGSSIRADATVAGDGGKVVLWSDGTTTAAGSISARGAGSGAGSGNGSGNSGGQVETSGHLLDVDGIAVDARAGASGGKNGTWLLDPYDIEVVAGGGAAAGDVKSASAGASSGVTKIAPGTLSAAGADVVLQAQHDLTVTDAIDASGSVQAQAGHDINVNAPVSAGGDLDFRAGNAFSLGTGGVLKTANYIDVQANTVALAGGIAGAGGQDPVLSFSSTDPGRAITVGSGTPDANVLWLDAATLGRLSGDLYEINLGNSLHSGPVSIASNLTASSNLVMESLNQVAVQGAVDLTANPASRFIASLYGAGAGAIQVSAPVKASSSILLQGDRLAIQAPLASDTVSLMPNNPGTSISVGAGSDGTGFALGQDALVQVKANTLNIGGLTGAYGALNVDGAVNLSGAGSPARLVLDAGAGALTVKARLATGGTLALGSQDAVTESDGGAITAPALALRGGSVLLSGANTIGTLAGSSGGGTDGVFQVSNTGQLAIGSVDGLSGITAGGALQLDAGGSLSVNAAIHGAGAAGLDAAGIGGSGVIQADTLSLRSSAGIGSTDSPLHTQASSLYASNQDSGSQPIDIANQGALVLLGAVQDGVANRGAIAIDSVGGMTVPAYQAATGGGVATGEVRTGSGDISLTTHSPMAILGRVATSSGNVTLLADNGGKLTIGQGASVSSGTGAVSITAGATDIASGTVTVSSPDKLHVADASAPPSNPDSPGPPATPPTLAACVADHGVAGCADVLDKALQACVANPDGPLCSQVLPTLSTCQATPTAAGCGVVLARNDVDQCLANPALPGCAAKIPSYQVCVATPSTYGCGQVIQQHDAVTACIANPNATGCAATLPTLAACRIDASVYGCVPVLAHADFEACVADPSLPGCLQKLPPLAQCKATPAAEGCAQVLQLTFQACLSNPNDASCSGILPTLGECVASPSKNGCDTVLPTLNQCIGSPSLQGCEVRLPTLAQCAAAPSTAGCEAVLPTASFCSVHPGDASCVIFSGNGSGSGGDTSGAPVAQAVQGAVQLINSGTSSVSTPGGQQDDGKAKAGAERLAGPAPAQLMGLKNEKPATKTYCN